MLVDLFPLFAEQGGDEQQQRTLGLVEVGDESLDHLQRIAGEDDEAGGGVQPIRLIISQILQDGLQGLFQRDRPQFEVLIHLPLLHVERVWAAECQLGADDEERLEGARHGGAHSDAAARQQAEHGLNALAGEHDLLLVHIVSADSLGAHGLEGARAHVERHILGGYALGLQRFQHSGCEVQSCRGGCHGAVVLGIDRLVALLVGGLCVALDIGRQGDLAVMLNPLGEAHGGIIPAEGDREGAVVVAVMHRFDADLTPVHGSHDGQRVFPFLGIAHHAAPGHLARLREGRGWVCGGGHGLQTEDLDGRSGGVVHQQACMDDLRVVEDQQIIRGEEVGQMVKAAVSDLAMAVDQQLGLVAFRSGIEGDAFFRERIVIIVNMDVLFFQHMGRKNTKKMASADTYFVSALFF